MPTWLENILNSSPELASVIIVVWFALKMNEAYRKNAAVVMADWRGHFVENDKKWMDFLSAYNTKWQEFIDEQNLRFCDAVKQSRDATNDAIGRIAEEVKSNTAKISENHALLLADRQHRRGSS